MGDPSVGGKRLQAPAGRDNIQISDKQESAEWVKLFSDFAGKALCAGPRRHCEAARQNLEEGTGCCCRKQISIEIASARP